MKCPNCQSTRVRKHGFYRDKQRYQCKDCARQFVENHTSQLGSQSSTGVEEPIDRYLQSIATPIPDLLLELRQATTDYPLSQMQPSLAQAQAIALLISASGANRVLELGIFSGYATLAIALALPASGRAICCGMAGEHLEIARNYWQQAGVNDKIEVRLDSGGELLDRLLAATPIEYFDAIVISGLKHQYPHYYQRAIELLRPQGLLIATDILWQGRALAPDTYTDDFTQGIATFNRQLATDKRMNAIALPIGDGLSIALKL